jgi:hypothetical protein
MCKVEAWQLIKLCGHHPTFFCQNFEKKFGNEIGIIKETFVKDFIRIIEIVLSIVPNLFLPI